MKIIGEKINGTRQRVKSAISARNAVFLQDLARKQAEAGASWLDINAGTLPEREPEDMVWLVETVQEAVDIPLCLDSTNPAALEAGIRAAKLTPMINSISGEASRLEEILPLAAGAGCPVIALAMDHIQIPETCGERFAIVQKVVSATRSSGIPDQQIYIDPLVMALSTNIESVNVFIETLKAVRAEYPDIHFTAGLSNISFGLPARSYINRTFLTLAMVAGLDTAIMDPLDRELQAAILTTQLVLGRDDYCLNFTQAYRDGVFSDR
ncbi:MAG: methyltetrahydrofolate cobalamin methyltransferase [Spirochaetales bacterium]|nr:methyltetrahydrofolate cobalamin methyltransferase [Spirochaetales bacterium]